MTDTDKPGYYAIIPAHIRYDDSLKAQAKLLYGELTALCNKEGYCWASNKYFSELYQVNPKTVSAWINELKRAGHIKTQVNREDGNSRKIFVTNPEKVGGGFHEKVETSPSKAEHNSTSITTTNNTSNITTTDNHNTLISAIEELWSKLSDKNPKIPKVLRIQNARLVALRKRVKEEPTLMFWIGLFRQIDESDFLSGRSGDWSASFDWVMKPANMVKILEGNYNQNKGAEEWEDKMRQMG